MAFFDMLKSKATQVAGAKAANNFGQAAKQAVTNVGNKTHTVTLSGISANLAELQAMPDENPYARQNIDEGYLHLQVESGSADSPHQIGLCTKSSTGEWFLWEQFILSDIRPPKSADPWA